jgi:hypothetical protein
MNRTQLPAPPDPTSPIYAGNPIAWQRAAFSWMQQVKGRIETDSAVNIRPIGPLSVSTYTAVSTVTGTDSLSNFVATLVDAMLTKGLAANVSQRSTT